jgi:hypothetical protein
MNKKTVGIISVVASCIVCSIAKRFFDKDREKELEEENKMVHDSVEKILGESRDKRMEKLHLEFEEEMEESRKKHEERMKKMNEEHEERMKKLEEERKELEKLEEKRQEQIKILDELKKRIKARDDQIDNATDFDEKIEAMDENRKDIMETFHSICGENHKTSGQKLADVLEAKLKEIKENN